MQKLRKRWRACAGVNIGGRK